MPNPLGRLFDRLSRKEVPEAKTPPRQVIIGLDFGTSGTKVAFRDWGPQEGGEILQLVDFGVDSVLGFPRFAVPSTIAFEDGRVFFGEEAERRSRLGFDTLRCLKTAIFSPDIRTAQAPMLARAGVKPEEDLWASDPVTQAEFPAAIFLAYVLNRSWDSVQTAYPDLRDEGFSVNLDVPVDNLPDSIEEPVFRRVCAAAMLLRSEIQQGMAVEDAVGLWKKTRGSASFLDLLRPGSRSEVVAEGQALIQGVGVAKDWGSGANYVTIDLGAGTTDVGVFRLHAFRERGRPGLTRRIPFYSAMTAMVGCDLIDQTLLEKTGAKPAAFERMRSTIRAAKSQLCGCPSDETVDLTGGWTLSRNDLVEAVTPTADSSYQHYRKSWGQAYKKDKNQCFWEELTLFVMGGGSLIPEFKERFSAAPHPLVKSVELWEVPGMDGANVVGASTDGLESSEIPFLVVANGLTFSPAWMPEMVKPQDVDEYGNIDKEIENHWNWEDGYSK